MEGGEAQDLPFEWIISRICEEFNCLPSAALRELMNDPAQMAIDIMELRAYARTKEMLDNAQNKADVKNTPMVEKVFEIIAEREKRRRENGRSS